MSYIPLNPALISETISLNQQDKHKKTIKSKPNVAKISSLNTIMTNIHNKPDDQDEYDDNNYSNRKNLLLNESEFNKAFNQDLKIDKNVNIDKPNIDTLNQQAPKSYLDNNMYSNYDKSYNKQFYSQDYINNGVTTKSNSDIGLNNKQLLDKLNYIIHLLEEQHNEKTNYLTEELILYLFLGIFIIFVLDSFSKASKYIR